jgi:hypothetical protein
MVSILDMRRRPINLYFLAHFQAKESSNLHGQRMVVRFWTLLLHSILKVLSRRQFLVHFCDGLQRGASSHQGFSALRDSRIPATPNPAPLP